MTPSDSNIRGFITTEYLKYHGPTDAEAGQFIVKVASDYGYSNRSRPIHGKTLRDWIAQSSAPEWAVKTMIRYILGQGFVPENDQQLLFIVRLFINEIDVMYNSHMAVSDIDAALGRVNV